MFGITVITPPTVEPVSLASARSFLHLDGTDHDDTLADLIAAATEHVQQATGRQFVRATFDITLNCFPHGTMPIYTPRSPLASVEHVKYYDRDEVLQTLNSVNYIVHTDREPGLIEPLVTWPATAIREDAVTVRFVAGYPGVGSPADPAGAVPGRATTAIKQLVAHWFENREAGEAPEHVGRLINGLKVWREV